MMKNVAIVEFNNCHHETIFTWIDFFLFKNWNIVIFINEDCNNWIKFLKKEKYLNLNIKNISCLCKNIYFLDFLVINTSHSIKNENNLYFKNILKYKKKIICVHHYDKPLLKNFNKNIIVTPLLKKYIKNSEYILPIFDYKIKKNKNKKYLFGFMGNMRHRDLDKFKYILELSNKNKFYVIYIGNGYGLETLNLNSYYYLDFYKNINTELLICKLNEIKYILPLVGFKSCYLKNRLTGIIPISINFNVPMIISRKLANIYKISEKTAIIFNFNFNNIINQEIIFYQKENNSYYKMKLNLLKFKYQIINYNRKKINNLISENNFFIKININL